MSQLFLKVSLAAIAFSLLIFLLQATETPANNALAVGSLTATCTSWNKGETIHGELHTHKFSSQEECLNAEKNGLGPSLVGGIGGTPVGSCTTNRADHDDNGVHYSCAVTASVPSCSVAQLDCMSGINGAGGPIGFNCSGCGGTPPPPPPKPQKHKECRSEACVNVSGPGKDQCKNDNDCKPKPKKHNECRNNACVKVSGPGSDRCHIPLQPGECVTPTPIVFCTNLSVSPISGNPGVTVNAAVSGQTQNGGQITSYIVNFGDGSGNVVQPGGSGFTHIYNSVGTFVVNGYVVDQNGRAIGGRGACQKTVTVTQTPPPPPPPPPPPCLNCGGGTTNNNYNENNNTNTNNITITTASTRGSVLGTNTITYPRTAPATGPEAILFPVLFGSGALGWAIRKFLTA